MLIFWQADGSFQGQEAYIHLNASDSKKRTLAYPGRIQTMTSLNRGPAKIYTFPARGRFVLDGQHDQAARAQHTPCAPGVASSSSWYHDEAIREAEQHKHKN